jgi:hypothetical protein
VPPIQQTRFHRLTDSPNSEPEEGLCAFFKSSRKSRIYLSIKYKVTVIVLVLILFTA